MVRRKGGPAGGGTPDTGRSELSRMNPIPSDRGSQAPRVDSRASPAPVANGLGAIPDNPLLLRARRAAEILAISPRKLWELTNRGEIPCVRIGRAVRYDPNDLAFWIEKSKKQQSAR